MATVDPREYSPSVTDEMILASRLRLEFLWADEYCILADDRAQQEEEEDILNLDTIYANAEITIIDAGGSRNGMGFTA